MTPKKRARYTTVSGLTYEDVNWWQGQGERFGYVSKTGPGRGRGNMSETLRAGPRGEVSLVKTEKLNDLLAGLRFISGGTLTGDEMRAAVSELLAKYEAEDGDA